MTDGEPAAEPITRRAIGARTKALADVPQEISALLPDLVSLQALAYTQLPTHAVGHAQDKDTAYPLWSSTHRFAPLKTQLEADPNEDNAWRIDWPGAKDLYVYSGLSLREIAIHSNIPLRRLEHMSSHYGWAESKRVHATLQSTALRAPRLSEMEEKTRLEAINTFLMDAGFEIGRQVLQALLRDPEKLTPREAAALGKLSMEMLSMGTRMPSVYRHSTVDNPNVDGHGQIPSINIMNITEGQAKDMLADLNRRAKLLEGAVLEGQVVEEKKDELPKV